MKTRARAPLRLGLAGGGTDLSAYSDSFGGAVLNCTIDRYAFAFLSPRKDGCLVFEANDLGRTETFSHPADSSTSTLALHRGVYQRIVNQFNHGQHLSLTITTSVDAPEGSGLGSSSALAVALVSAFSTMLDLPLGQYDVAHLAYEIERIDLALSGGKQDQYAAAFGGINFIEFLNNDRVIVNPLRVPDWITKELESGLVVAFSGRSRSSAAIIDRQTQAIHDQSESALAGLHQLKADALDMKAALLSGEVDKIAEILNGSWRAKKQTATGISNEHIDEMYNLALQAGAIGGKVSGAGGGGFMIFLVPPERRLQLIGTLNGFGAVASPVKLTHHGVEAWRLKS